MYKLVKKQGATLFDYMIAGSLILLLRSNIIAQWTALVT